LFFCSFFVFEKKKENEEESTAVNGRNQIFTLSLAHTLITTHIIFSPLHLRKTITEKKRKERGGSNAIINVKKKTKDRVKYTRAELLFLPRKGTVHVFRIPFWCSYFSDTTINGHHPTHILANKEKNNLSPNNNTWALTKH